MRRLDTHIAGNADGAIAMCINNRKEQGIVRGLPLLQRFGKSGTIRERPVEDISPQAGVLSSAHAGEQIIQVRLGLERHETYEAAGMRRAFRSPRRLRFNRRPDRLRGLDRHCFLASANVLFSTAFPSFSAKPSNRPSARCRAARANPPHAAPASAPPTLMRR